MAVNGYNLWLERFKREAGIKSALIVYGSTNDIMLDTTNMGLYVPVIQAIVSSLMAKGYKNIVRWDRVDGIAGDTHQNLVIDDVSPSDVQYTYDMGPADDIFTGSSTPQAPQARYRDASEFFPYMLNMLRNNPVGTAFVLDYSDYLFGNANSLSEQEREYLATLGKALQSGQSYDMNRIESLESLASIVVLVVHNSATIPPAFYQGNPLVSLINVPLPGRNEREKFVTDNLPILRISQNLDDDKTALADFVDALDGLTLREIAQLMKLSRQTGAESLGYEKLINLFKYGEKISPWEELSREKLDDIKGDLKKRVKGQDGAINKVRDVIIRAYTGFAGLQHSSKQRKPKGTLFFVGPTGVGKTELAKAIARFVFGDEDACIRFDMSEYNHEHSDQRLVGAPPGYVGYEAGGQLTNAVRERPFCVLLFDEIEKAHGKILDKFLQILEDGRLTDGKGETVYFSETIIIFTSNLGAADASAGDTPKEVRKHFINAVRDHFVNELHRPELLNRIGNNIVAFNFISDPEVFVSIARSKFVSVKEFVREKYKAELVFEDETAAFAAVAAKAGPENGGRGMLNLIESAIIDPLSLSVFQYGEYLTGRKLVISLLSAEKLEFDFQME